MKHGRQYDVLFSVLITLNDYLILVTLVIVFCFHTLFKLFGYKSPVI